MLKPRNLIVSLYYRYNEFRLGRSSYMFLKNYYQILELSPSATDEEIKQAYRQLAKRYHPDSNPNPSAHKRFVEINEAYQALGTEKERYRYDQQRKYQEEYLERQRQRQASTLPPQGVVPYQDKTPPTKTISPWLRNYSRIAQLCTWTAFLFSTILLIDFLLPRRVFIEPVQSVKRLRVGKSDYRLYTAHTNFLIIRDYALYTQPGEYIGIYQTLMFRVVDTIRVKEEGQIKRFRPAMHLYSGPYWALAIMMWVPMLVLDRTDYVLKSCSGTFSVLLCGLLTYLLLLSY